jgi:hypothetical protein
MHTDEMFKIDNYTLLENTEQRKEGEGSVFTLIRILPMSVYHLFPLIQNLNSYGAESLFVKIMHLFCVRFTTLQKAVQLLTNLLNF